MAENRFIVARVIKGFSTFRNQIADSIIFSSISPSPVEVEIVIGVIAVAHEGMPISDQVGGTPII